MTLSQVSNNDKLVHAAGENIVLVYYLQTPEKDPNGKGVLRYSYQKLKFKDAVVGNGAGLQFAEPNFQTYKIPIE